MNRIMMIMKNAGNNAVIVRIPESGSPYRCMNIPAIMKNFGIAIMVKIQRVIPFSVIPRVSAVDSRFAPTAPTSIAVNSIRP